MIVYDRLWETMKKRGVSQYRLIKYFKFSAGQINRLKNNAYVSTHTLDVLCTILDCDIEDIMEFRSDPSLIQEVELVRQNAERRIYAEKQGADAARLKHPRKVTKTHGNSVSISELYQDKGGQEN